MQLKVVTYNIRHGLGIDAKVDLGRILDILRISEADIMSLNEVDRYKRRSGFTDQARYLARSLKMYYRFGPAYGRLFAQSGNALLSKFPILKSWIVHLPSTREPRVALKALIRTEHSDVKCICTHLGLSSEERFIQSRELMKIASEEEGPLILMGDLNALPRSPEVMMLSQRLIDTMSDNDQATFPSLDPQERIDYVFISKNCAIINANTIKSLASDHLPVIAVMEVE